MIQNRMNCVNGVELIANAMQDKQQQIILMHLINQQLLHQQQQFYRQQQQQDDLNAAQLLLSLSSNSYSMSSALTNNINETVDATVPSKSFTSTHSCSPSTSPSPVSNVNASSKILKPHPKFRAKVRN